MNTKITPKDFFLHLGATIVLYSAVVALINLSFSIINYFRPDPLAYGFYSNTIAWPISMLVILVPLLYILETLISRDMARMPEKKDLWIRKWRIYLTLFLAIALIGGDLITLINTYLSGEITSRFVYKVIAILIIAGTAGKYYFFSLYDNLKWSKRATRMYPWVGIILVLAAIVGGFIIVGSPSKQRDLKLDTQRVNDLTNIQWQIISTWQRTEKLPATLADLNDPISNFMVPNDPSTDAPYEYSVKGPHLFQLCATFARPTEDTKGRGDTYGRGGGIIAPMPVSVDGSYPTVPVGGNNMDSWAHQSGKTCYDRTIDPSRYPPYNVPPKGI